MDKSKPCQMAVLKRLWRNLNRYCVRDVCLALGIQPSTDNLIHADFGSVNVASEARKSA